MLAAARGPPPLHPTHPTCTPHPQGHALYYGAAAAAGPWFAALGYPLPFGVSLADFALDLASGEVAGVERCAGLDGGGAG